MKKLYIGFILLFGFLAFVPQIALGDRIVLPRISETEAREIQKEQTKELECLKKKKSKINEEYTGPNLVSQAVPNYKRGERALVLYKERNISGKTIYIGSPSTTNQYYIENVRGVGIGGVAISIVSDCKEYVMNSDYEGFDVTYVPPGSYLKYIPRTEEVQVFSPSEAEEQLKISHEKEVSRVSPNSNFIPDFVIRGMLIALLLTLVIEGLLAAPFGWKFVGLVSLANIITNPALNGIIWHYQITETATILWLEAAVVLIEWGIFSVFIRKNYGKLLLFAFVANLVSYLSGVFFPL